MRRQIVGLVCGLVFWAGAVGATDLRLDFYADIRELAEAGEFLEAERRLEEAFLGSAAAPADERIALLESLGALQRAFESNADAGDTYANQAALMARSLGPDSPDLAPVYQAAASAYLEGQRADRAIAMFEAALRIDRRYLPCESAALTSLYSGLSEAYAMAGDTTRAAETDRLANDPAARCALADPRRNITVETSETEGEFAQVDVFYATDRKPTEDPRPSGRFGWERGALSFGRAAVTIPRDHKPGQIEAPSLISLSWEENPSLHVVLMAVEPLEEDRFFAEIGATQARLGDDEVFLFIHGFNVTFAAAAKRTAQMAYDLNFGGVPVFYSWPSRGHPGSYMADAATVQVSARNLTGFLADFADRLGHGRIHIVAHSMGNRALMEALELFALSHPESGAIFDQIIFAAPDVDAELFVLQVKTFAQLARRMTLYTSNADLALSTSRQLHGNAARAGHAVDAPLVTDAVDTIDMSVVGDGVLNHSYFAADASALSDILWLFWRNTPPPARCGMDEKAGPDGAHWVYVAEHCESNVLLSAISLARQSGTNALARLDARIAEVQSDIVAEHTQALLDELATVRLQLVELLGL